MAECKYYDAKDIMVILKVGKRKAFEILHMFEERGELLRLGKVMRVRKAYFDAWIDRKDGQGNRNKTIEKFFSAKNAS